MFPNGGHRIKCACGGAHSTKQEVWQCSRRRGGNLANQQASPPPIATRPTLDDQLKAMLESTKSGRYAVRLADDQPYKFFRLSRPTVGKYKDALKIQSQHSEEYKPVAVIWPNGKVTLYNGTQETIIHLRLLVCDPTTATIAYGTEMRRCGICGKELTDPRSRFYGIGPECEKHFPEVIAMVQSMKGAFDPLVHS